MNAAYSSSQFDSTTTLKLTVQSVTDHRVLTVIAKLHTDLSHDFTAKELGQEVGLCESQLRALFKIVTGMPLAHFIKQERMAEAHYLFTTEFLTVAEVMARVGFHDKSHFSHDFKTMYGISPGKFRQQCLKGK